MIYHIAHKSDWYSAQKSGSYTADSLSSQGFIHCSTATQVVKVANNYYRGVKDLVLLSIDPGLLTVEVRYENLEGGEELFPHIYGVIPISAIPGVLDFNPSQDGNFQFPGETTG
jgi:uncharacterized protein (DUF952 family)